MRATKPRSDGATKRTSGWVPPAQQQAFLWGLALAGLLIVGGAGCSTREMAVVLAQNPDTNVAIGRFEIEEQQVTVFKQPAPFDLYSHDGERVERLVVHPREQFEAYGFNRRETWKLLGVSDGHGLFDVHARMYSCVDPFAVFLNIPSQTSRRFVIVCPHAGDEVQNAAGANEDSR